MARSYEHTLNDYNRQSAVSQSNKFDFFEQLKADYKATNYDSGLFSNYAGAIANGTKLVKSNLNVRR